jgi:hypothetical protein
MSRKSPTKYGIDGLPEVIIILTLELTFLE